MSRTRRVVGIGAIPALLLSWAVADARGAGFEREVEVARPGWVRVGLDGRALATIDASGGWELLSPGGEPLASALLRPPREEQAARTVSVTEGDDGWRIVFDLGPARLEHRRVEIDLARATTARGCTLDGSHDVVRWTRLAEGDLFRIGGDRRLERTALEYADTDARYLALGWPRAAGFPELRRVAVLPLPPEPVPLAVEVRPVETAGRIMACRLELPATGRGVRALVLEHGPLAIEPPGFRLYAASGQGAEVAGVLAAAGETRIAAERFVPLGHSLRLDLYLPEGTAESPVESVRLDTDPAWIAFEAAAPGRYALRYGDRGERPSRTPPALDAIGPLVEARAGVERSLPAAPIPAEYLEPFDAPAPAGGAESWPVLLGERREGGPVRLILPHELSRAIERGDGHLRLVAGTREVPFVLHAPAESELVADLDAGRVESAAASRTLELRDPALTAAVTRLEVIAWGGRPTGALELLRPPRSGRPGVEERPVRIRTPWTCDASPAVPCRAVVDPAPSLDGRLELEVASERGGPPIELRLRAWSRRSVLVFVPPASRELRMVHEPGPPPGPGYPLRQFRESLLARPWVEASLDLDAVAEHRARTDFARRALVLAALALAGLVLVWVLARSLRTRSG